MYNAFMQVLAKIIINKNLVVSFNDDRRN